MPLTAMNQAFFQQDPTSVNTPYRQLVISKSASGWRVRLTGGTKWGAENRTELRTKTTKTFKAAKAAYDEAFRELQAEGWKPYMPGPLSSI